MRLKKLSRIVFAVFAIVLLGSVSAFAQQLPLAPTAIPQFVQELPRLTLDKTGIPVTLGSDVTDAANPPNVIRRDVDVSMCEFQASILPIGTPIAGVPAITAPLTWVWGYEAGACPDPATVTHPYIGPVIIAQRGTPTQMTYWNRLPDVGTSGVVGQAASNVKAYTLSTDQTLQWADPFSLRRDGTFLNPYPGITSYRVDYTLNPLGDYTWIAPFPENNDCNLAVKQFHDGVLDLVGVPLVPLVPVLPAPCLNNYGFLGPQLPPAAAPATYIAPVPAAPHLHGGEIPAFLDGGPDAWWTPNGIYGHGYYSKGGTLDAAAGKAIYTYPNVQDAAPTWFHDHILGATRLNVYAGIAGAYYQIDPGLALPAGMHPLGLMNGAPNPAVPLLDGVELLIPLVIQDRIFDTSGQLLFPAVGINPEHPFWVPEFVGDVIVVNGKAWPMVTVEPKRYRFLVLNGSNARSYELFLTNPITKVMGPSIWVIGNDQGYLEAPVKIDPLAAVNNKLVLMPGERYEIIVDFGLQAGATLQMRNTAKTPYPGGAAVAGNTTGRIVNFVVGPKTAGFVDNSYDPATLTPIRTPLVRLANPATGTLALQTGSALPIKVDVRRQLTLNEVIAIGGPIEILMNNTTYTGEESLNKRTAAGMIKDFADQTTKWNTTYYSERPQEGTTELWEIVNLTADAHPIHPHLVAFQILNRQKFDFKAYNAFYDGAFPAFTDLATGIIYPAGVYNPAFGPPCDYDNPLGIGAAATMCTPPPSRKGPWVPPAGYVPPVGGNPDVTFYLKGAVKPPTPAEQGWKDTAISYPGEVLRLLIRFAPTHLANTTLSTDPSAAYKFDPSEGHGYVWHCHIIDHEDNEMMRPFNVIPNGAASRTFVPGMY